MVRSGSRLGSAARVLAILCVGAFAGAALTAHLGAQAEDAGVSFAQLQALTARVTALEDAKDKPQKLKAPFEVIDVRGQTILSVVDTGGGVSFQVGTGDALVTLSTNGGDPKIELEDGQNNARLAVLKDGPVLDLASGSASVTIKADGTGPSLAMNQGNEPVFVMDTAQGGPQLKVQKGSQVARMQALPNQTGVLVDTSTHFQMGDIENIRGFVASRGDLPFAGLGAFGNDQYRVVIYNGSTSPVFEGGFDRESGQAGLFVGDASGKRIGQITSAPGGELQLFNAGGQGIATLGPNDDGARLNLGVGNNGIFAKTNGSTATIITSIGGKVAEMGVTARSTGFVVGEEAKPLAALADNGDGKPFLNIYGSGSPSPVVSLGMATGSGALRVFSNGGELAVIAGALDEGRGSVKVYESNRIMAGMEAVGSGSSVIYVSSNENDVAGMYNERGEGSIAVKNKQNTLVELGTLGNAGTVVTSVDGKPVVALGPTKQNSNPAVRVFKDGTSVFAAGAGSSGNGAVAVYADGQLRAGVEAQGGNGHIYVMSGETEVASINSTDMPGQGLVIARGKSGTASAFLSAGTSGGGHVELNDPSGNEVFSAGYDGDGPGYACVNRKGKKCLGVGLTGMEGFH